MKRALTIAAAVLFSFSAFASDTLRSGRHFLKIEAAGNSGQYNVQVFDGESRSSVAQLKVMTKGGAPAEAETTAGGTRYNVLIVPHGVAYLVEFKAYEGTELIDAMRGGFTGGAKPNAAPARAARGGRDVNAPKVVRRVDAVYTEEARAAGAAGSVVVEVLIDRSGFVREATVLQPIGHGLSEAAIDAVKQWQFEPSMQQGVPVEVQQEVTIDFKP